jgi:hypothetical protein
MPPPPIASFELANPADVTVSSEQLKAELEAEVSADSRTIHHGFWRPPVTSALTCAIGEGVTKPSPFASKFTFAPARCARCPVGSYSAGGRGVTCRLCSRSLFRPALTGHAGVTTRLFFGHPYWHGWSNGQLRPCQRCPAGYGLYGNPPVCTQCPANTYSPGGIQGPCYPCPAAMQGALLLLVVGRALMTASLLSLLSSRLDLWSLLPTTPGQPLMSLLK